MMKEAKHLMATDTILIRRSDSIQKRPSLTLQLMVLLFYVLLPSLDNERWIFYRNQNNNSPAFIFLMRK